MSILNFINKIWSEYSDYWWSGIFKTTHFAIRLVIILLLSTIVENPGYFLALHALIELVKIAFDFGMEMQIINGISKSIDTKIFIRFRVYFSIIGQAFVSLIVVATYEGKDFFLMLLSSLTFCVLMIQGFTTATLQINQLFAKYIKKYWWLYILALTIGYLAWFLNLAPLLIFPEILLAVTSFIYIKPLSTNSYGKKSLGFVNFMNSSKHYALNAVLSTFYTRTDTLMIFIFQTQSIAAYYLYTQRIMSAPLFVISFIASVYLTKVAKNINYLRYGVNLAFFSAFGLILYFFILMLTNEINTIMVLVFILILIKIINSYLTAALIAINKIKIVSHISSSLALLSVFFIAGGIIFKEIIYLPLVLIFSELVVLIFSLRGLRSNANN